MKKLVSGCIAVSMVLGMMAGSTAMAADDALDNIKERGKLIVATDAAWLRLNIWKVKMWSVWTWISHRTSQMARCRSGSDQCRI